MSPCLKKWNIIQIFCTFEIASLPNVPGLYLKKYSMRENHFQVAKYQDWKIWVKPFRHLLMITKQFCNQICNKLANLFNFVHKSIKLCNDIFHEYPSSSSIFLLWAYHQFQIEVMVPPAVQSKPREGLIVTRKGQDVTLRCSGRGNPNPRITWSKKVKSMEILFGL